MGADGEASPRATCFVPAVPPGGASPFLSTGLAVLTLSQVWLIDRITSILSGLRALSDVSMVLLAQLASAAKGDTLPAPFMA